MQICSAHFLVYQFNGSKHFPLRPYFRIATPSQMREGQLHLFFTLYRERFQIFMGFFLSSSYCVDPMWNQNRVVFTAYECSALITSTVLLLCAVRGVGLLTF